MLRLMWNDGCWERGLGRLRNSPLSFLLCDEAKLLRTKQVVARARLRITPYWQAMAKTHSTCPKISQPRQPEPKRGKSGKKLYAIRIELQLAQKESLISMKFLFVGRGCGNLATGGSMAMPNSNLENKTPQ
jgi:hypothetical protein